MEAGNRAARAREAADHAAVNFWISLGVGAAMAATGGCLAGFGSVASGAVRAGMVLLKLTAPAMNLATGINNIIYYAGLAEEDKGGLEDDYETVKQQRALEVRSQALGAAGKLSALEEALFEEAGKNLLSKFGMNAGFFSGFQSRLERLYKIKEIVDELLENEVEKILTALEIMGGIVKKFHFLSEAERNSKIAAFSAIENILNTLRSIGSRDNEIREARLMLIKSVVSSSLSAIEIILSFINVNRSEKAHELKLAEESGGLDVNGRRDLDNLNTQNEFWSTVPVLLKLVGILKVFSGLLTTAIYRAAQDEKTADGPEEGESPEENAKGMGTAMYALETDTVNAQMASGEGSLEREQVLQDADLADEGIAAGRGATEESISMFDSWKREDDQKRIKAGLQEEKKEAAARLKFHNGEGPTIISSC
jgi:hypothetical protein